MASWKKVIVSGSDASLASVTTTGNIIATGSLAANSTVRFPGLTNVSQASIVGIDVATGQLYYQGTGSFTANSASYALSASYASNASTADSATSASYASNASTADSATSASYASNASTADSATSASYANNASTADSASYALSASYTVNSDTASYVNPLNQKVEISGSLSILTATGNSFDSNADTFIFTGSLSTTGSVQFTGLTAQSASYLLGIDPTNGNVFYTSTGSVVSMTSSFAVSASHAENADNAQTASFAQSGDGSFSGSFSGSFQGNGSGLTNIPASGIVGLNLSQIASGSATASISPDNGFQVNVPTSIDGALAVTGSITAGNIVSTGANSQLTGSFTGSFAGNFVGTSNLPDLTQGTGITTFTYDGSTTATVAVSGAAGLTTNTVTKWSGDAFVNSSITDALNVTINNNGGVLVQAGGLYVTGASTFHDDVVMQGNLTVQGTASFQNATNLAIADQFILLNSGSSTFQDSGFIINTGNAANSGSAFFLETAGTTTGTDSLNGRFAVAANVLPDATSVTAVEYANTTVISGSAPGNAIPQFGGTGLGQGNMWVDTATSDIWIYA